MMKFDANYFLLQALHLPRRAGQLSGIDGGLGHYNALVSKGFSKGFSQGLSKGQSTGIAADLAGFAWAYYETEFGKMFAVVREASLYYLGFETVSGASDDASVMRLLDNTAPAFAQVSAVLRRVLQCLIQGKVLPLGLRGTPFQRLVWEGLMAYETGVTGTYGSVATRVGRPTSVRAVASAIGANPWAVLVPCHRICRADGGLGGYRWGLELKRAFLAAEGARVSAASVKV